MAQTEGPRTARSSLMSDRAVGASADSLGAVAARVGARVSPNPVRFIDRGHRTLLAALNCTGMLPTE